MESPTSTAPLVRLPVETLERVLEELDIAAIQNLRLVCRSLGDKCIGPSYLRHFQSQKTDLSPESLAILEQLALHPRLGPALKQVIIMATLYDTTIVARMVKEKTKRVVERNGPFTVVSEPRCTEEELVEAQADLDWLSARQQATSNEALETSSESLAALFTKIGHVHELRLDARVMQTRKEFLDPSCASEWHAMWMLASKTFSITVSAMARSHIEVHSFIAFKWTRRCSVQSIDVLKVMEQEADNFVKTGEFVRSFALSFSTRIRRNFQEIVDARERLDGGERVFHDAFGSNAGLYDGDDPDANAPENFLGVASLLKSMPNLECVDLRQYHTLQGPAFVYEKLFEEIVQQVQLPRLKGLTLRGLYATEGSLLQFLQNHPGISQLDLRDFHLSSGSWDPIFEYFSKMPELKNLHLSNLTDQTLVNLEPQDSSFIVEQDTHHLAFPILYGGNLFHTRTIGVEEIKQGLNFKPRPQYRALGSPQRFRWLEAQRQEYGPPTA